MISSLAPCTRFKRMNGQIHKCLRFQNSVCFQQELFSLIQHKGCAEGCYQFKSLHRCFHNDDKDDDDTYMTSAGNGCQARLTALRGIKVASQFPTLQGATMQTAVFLWSCTSRQTSTNLSIAFELPTWFLQNLPETRNSDKMTEDRYGMDKCQPRFFGQKTTSPVSSSQVLCESSSGQCRTEYRCSARPAPLENGRNDCARLEFL